MIPGLYFSQLSLGFLDLQAWGLLVSIGSLSALFISLKEAERKKIDQEIIWNLMILALLSMILGGKLFYSVLFLISSGGVVFSFNSGFSFIGGGLLAGILVFLYLKSSKQDWKKISDLLVVGFIVSLISTRIGCLLISDHIGKITTLPWGMQYIDGTVRHPVALYHILFLSLILLIIKRLQRKKTADGFLTFSFLSLYSFFRFITDFFRCSDLAICDAHFWGLTATQLILVPIFFVSLLEVRKYSKLRSRIQD
jgi:phosphatidylglycerol:prolipoprotein diacylglycerol transferase